MSTCTTQKVQNLIDAGSIQLISDTTYRVHSSIPGESYVINGNDNIMQCQCHEFFCRKNCIHIQAVKIIHQAKRDAIIAKAKTQSKEQILQRCKTLITNLKQRGWKNSEEHKEWRSHISSWREELALLGPMVK